MRLNGKKALVTGASRGIGRSVAELFIAEGAEVWGLGTKEPADLSARVEAAGGKLHWLSADVGDAAAIEATVKDAIKASGGFDVLVNSAGITKDGLSFRMAAEDFVRVLEVNLVGSFLVARTVAWDLVRRKSPGSIVNMASVIGVHGNAGQANYAASKAGLIGATKSLAQECAARGIRVNAIAPGFIATDMTDALPEDVKAKYVERIPLGRMGAAEDVAKVALFLACDESAYITGQVLPVDGGMFM